MPARLKLIKATRHSATMLVLGVRFDGKAQADSAADLANSDHDDYRRIKPISAEGCDTLLVERLEDRLR